MARWIKVYDGLLEWEWHKRPEMVSLFIHLIMMANAKDGRFEGIEVKRGQFVTSLASLSDTTGISVQTIRTCLKHLQETGEISIKSTSRFSVITVSKYEDYQVNQTTANKQPTSDQQATNKRLTTNKEYKIEDIYNNPPISKEIVPPSLQKGESMDERAKKFGKQLIPYVETYGKEMIRDFYDYWTGHDEGDTKMAFEKAKSRSKSGVFNIPRRLATWKRMDDEKQTPTPKRMQKGCSIMEALAATGMIGEEPQTDKLIGQ